MHQNPYTAPRSLGLGSSEQPQTMERGGCLTAFLVLALIANPITGLSYLLGGEMVRRGMPGMPEWALPVLGVLSFVQFAFILGIWRWKKWGVIGALALAPVTLILNFSIGVPPGTAILGMVGPLILFFLVKPRWPAFR